MPKSGKGKKAKPVRVFYVDADLMMDATDPLTGDRLVCIPTRLHSRFFTQRTQQNKERYISKLFLRGDLVILVLRNPN